MAWTNYSMGVGWSGLFITPPLQGSDGNMWAAGTGPSTGGTYGAQYLRITPLGTKTITTGSTNSNAVGTLTNLVTEGTYMVLGYRNSFPRAYRECIKISSLVTNIDQQGLTQYFGAVRISTDIWMLGTIGGSPELEKWPINSGGISATNSYAPGVSFGGAVYDGTYIWSPAVNTTTFYRLTPSGGLAGTSYTLAAIALDYGYYAGGAIAAQIGYDGAYIYLAAKSGGIIIFDTAAHTSNLVNSGTNFVNCYYSANLALVVCDDTSQNIYTMPTGASGGAVTNIGNKNTITGATMISTQGGGFGDGPNNTIWGAAAGSGPNPVNIFWQSTVVSQNPIVMLV